MRRGRRRKLITKTRWRKWLSSYTDPLARAHKRFVNEAVFGMLVAASPVLSEMARAVRSWGQCLDYIVKRFSRNLRSKHFEPETLRIHLLERNASFVGRDTPIYIDLSDISKPHARKMPSLCKVRDASDPRKPIRPGYWLLEAYAEPSRGLLVPLLLVVFSTRQRKFVSQNKVIIGYLRLLHSVLGPRGIFVMDRGFDARVYFEELLEMRHRFIVRLKDGRDLVCEDGKKRRVGRLAMALLRPADGPQVVRSLRVRLPGDHRPLLYAAVPRKPNDPRPLKLLAWLGEGQLDLEAWAHRCRCLYRRRWAAEDGIRFLKSEVSLERVRVMSWRALEHMMNVAALTMTIIALIAREPIEWLTELLRAGGPRRTKADFLFYRIRRSLAHLLPLNPCLPSEV